MKSWAKRFYESRSWRETREAYMVSQQYVCERCGGVAKICHHKEWLDQDNINNPWVTLCWDNLEALCQDCHNREHHAKAKHVRYRFDDAGNVIENK